MRSVDPTTGQTLRDYPDHDDDDVRERLARAAAAAADWGRRTPAERAAALGRVAAVLRRARAEHAALMTAEMGKPIAQAEAEVDKCAWVCEHYAARAPADLAPEPTPSDAARSLVLCQPLGVVLAIMPWNFPFWQVFRAAAPAIAAGNTVVLKHAANVPGCAVAIEAVFAAAGLPAGVFTTLLVPAGAVERLIRHPAVRGVTLTGSDAAGRAVATAAGAAIKKTVLELGGSDAFVVLDDADPAAVARQALAARLINNGQSCIAAKRFIVAAALAEDFERELAGLAARVRIGDPRDRTVELGPLARPDLVDELDRQVRDSVALGARLAAGGQRPSGAGNFYPATVLTAVAPGMPAFDEETFGPVAAVTRARDEAEAVALANHSRFGLGASVWTAEPARGERLAAALEAGAVFVNGMVRSDPRLPFGGIKDSGYGRELGAAGLREFVNLKTVWIG